MGPADAIQWDGEVTVYPIQPEDDPRGWIAETYTEANARFIAAAPDLEAALENFIYEASLPGADMDEGNVEEARTALAKARGGDNV